MIKLLQMRLLVLVASFDTYCVLLHIVRVAHTVLDTLVAAAVCQEPSTTELINNPQHSQKQTWNWLELQNVMMLHTRSLVLVGAIDWYCPVVHVVTAEHTRLEVVVGGDT